MLKDRVSTNAYLECPFQLVTIQHEYESWRTFDGLPILWLCGPPGSGKSVLASSLWHQLNATQSQDHAPVACFSDRLQRSPEPAKRILRCLIQKCGTKSLTLEDKVVLKKIARLTDTSRASLPPDGFRRHLKRILSCLGTESKSVLVFDNFDDCEWLHEQIAQGVAEINEQLGKEREVRCLITSRCSSRRATGPYPTICLEEEVSASEDVIECIHGACKSLSTMFPTHIDGIQTLEKDLCARAEISFVGVTIVLRSFTEHVLGRLRYPYPVSTKQISGGIENLYQQHLQSIPKPHQLLASRVFTWLSCAMRPLHLQELQGGMIVKIPSHVYESQIVRKEFLQSYCAGLITINQDDTIQLVHSSLRDYLSSENHRTSLGGFHVEAWHAHDILAQACLQYLLELCPPPQSDNGITESSGLRLLSPNHGPFEDYATAHWSAHFKEAEVHSAYLMGMLQRLVRCSILPLVWYFDSGIHDPASRCPDEMFRISAGLDSQTLCRLYLEMGADVNGTSKSCGSSALHYAAANGSLELAELLIEHGANVNVLSTQERKSPLDWACENGSYWVVESLLKHGADCRGGSWPYRDTPLYTATRAGQIEVLGMLLDWGANPNTKSGLAGRTPLHVAAAFGFVEEVEFLLGSTRYGLQSDTEMVLYREESPLAKKGDVVCGEAQEPNLGDFSCGEVTHRSKFRYQPEIDARDKNGWTPLHLAAAWGNQRVVELLVKFGANVKALTYEGQCALSLTAEKGHDNIVSLILGYTITVGFQISSSEAPKEHLGRSDTSCKGRQCNHKRCNRTNQIRNGCLNERLDDWTIINQDL